MDISRSRPSWPLAVAALEIPNLDTYAFAPAKPSIPCFYVGEVSIEPNNTFGDGCDVAEVTCRVLVSTADDADGQLLLDQYLSRTGTYSIRAALLAARGDPGELALNGKADDLMIVRIDGYRMLTDAEQRVLLRGRHHGPSDRKLTMAKFVWLNARLFVGLLPT
jgi:hypothetical protein